MTTKAQHVLASLQRTASNPAEAGFDEFKDRVLQPFLSGAQRQIVDSISDLMDGQFPSKQVEYAVMRHKPLSMTDEDFIEEMLPFYEKWVRTVRVGR